MANSRLNAVHSRFRTIGFDNEAETVNLTLSEIYAILHPVEVEEIPITLWWVDSQPSGKRSFDDEALALRCCRNDEKPIPLQTTIRREKKVVDRSVSGRVMWKRVPNGSCEGFVYPCGLDGAIDLSALIGKTGLLTFEWTE